MLKEETARGSHDVLAQVLPPMCGLWCLTRQGRWPWATHLPGRMEYHVGLASMLLVGWNVYTCFHMWGSVSISFFCSFFLSWDTGGTFPHAALPYRQADFHTCLYMCISSFVVLLCRFAFSRSSLPWPRGRSVKALSAWEISIRVRGARGPAIKLAYEWC